MINAEREDDEIVAAQGVFPNVQEPHGGWGWQTTHVGWIHGLVTHQWVSLRSEKVDS